MSNDGTIDILVKDQLGVVTFAHPKSNSLPGKLLNDLANAVKQMDADPSVSVILLQSAGDKAFCAGASFDELKALNNPEEGQVFFSGFANVILAMISCSKLIVGKIQGKAVGGGVGLIATCDYTVAVDSASVKLSELAIGLGPFVIGPVVEHKIGKANFMNMAIDADWRTAEWALNCGLYSQIVSDTDLKQATQDLCSKLVSCNPEACQELKKIFWNDAGHWPKLLTERAQISGKLSLSDYVRKAVG